MNYAIVMEQLLERRTSIIMVTIGDEKETGNENRQIESRLSLYRHQDDEE